MFTFGPSSRGGVRGVVTLGDVLVLLPLNGNDNTGYAHDASIYQSVSKIVRHGKISTAQSKWNGSSLRCDSGHNYPGVIVPWNSRLNNAKTWQFWVRMDTVHLARVILTQQISAAEYAPIVIGYTASLGWHVQMGNTTRTAWAVDITCNDIPATVDTWHFVRVTLSGTTVSVSRDGTTSATTGTLSGGLATPHGGARDYFLGGIPNIGSPPAFVGYLNDFCVTDAVETGVPADIIAQEVSAPSAPAGVGAHRHWCVNLTNAGQYNSVTELEFRQTFTGLRSISQTNTGGTASADNNYPGEVPANAFNGTFSGSRYASQVAASRLKYDFGSAVDIREVALGFTFGTGQNPETYNIEYSDDGSSWTSVKSFVLGQFQENAPIDAFIVQRVEA